MGWRIEKKRRSKKKGRDEKRNKYDHTMTTRSSQWLLCTQLNTLFIITHSVSQSYNVSTSETLFSIVYSISIVFWSIELFDI